MIVADVFGQRDEDGIVVLLSENPRATVAEDPSRAATVCHTPTITLEGWCLLRDPSAHC